MENLSYEYIIAAIDAVPDFVRYGGPGVFVALLLVSLFRRGSTLSMLKNIFTVLVAVGLCWCLLPAIFWLGTNVSNWFGSGTSLAEPYIMLNIVFFVALFVVVTTTAMVYTAFHSEVK